MPQTKTVDSPVMILFTGLSGAGKTTLASKLKKYITDKGHTSILLDGDIIRKGLSKDLSFSKTDRIENLRRIAEVAKILLDEGIIVLSAFLSPYEKDRAAIKEIVGSDRYIEIYLNCGLEVCERRDVKGLYLKARLNQISNFTGISDIYEAPISPHLEVCTDKLNIENSFELVLTRLQNLFPLIAQT